MKLPWVVATGLAIRSRYWASARELRNHVEQTVSNSSAPWDYKLFSQNGEDGILAAIFSRIGVGPRRFVELGFGIYENNSLAFALQNRARGLYVDGSEQNCKTAKSIYFWAGLPFVRTQMAWIERDNIDSIVGSYLGRNKEVDVLSVDLDGNDYWIWSALTSINPRVVVVEYNASFGAERAVTVPYDPQFERHKFHPSGICHGMSVQAATLLGQSRGYALVKCDAAGVNAFFVRRDLLNTAVPESTPAKEFRPHSYRIKNGRSQQEQEAIALSCPLIDLSSHGLTLRKDFGVA